MAKYGELIARANELQMQQAYDAAVKLYHQAMQLEPNNANAYNNCGQAYQDSGRYIKALLCYQQAIRLEPDDYEAYFRRGALYYNIDQPHKALADFNQVISLKPDLVIAYNSRGNVYKNLEFHDLALQDYDKTIELDQQHYKAYYNRGNIFQSEQEYQQAIACYDQALALESRYQAAYLNRANCYKNLGNYEQAKADYQMAAKLANNSYEAEYNLSLLLLRDGDFKQGWALNDKRFLFTERVYYDQKVFTHEKRWQGQDLKDKVLIVIAEQGVGDTLQFLRLGPKLKAQTIIFLCHEELLDIAEQLSWPDMVFSLKLSVVQLKYDYHITLIGLARFYLPDIKAIPQEYPYIKVSEPRPYLLDLLSELKASSQPKIGVAWAGNPEHVNDANRSTEIAHFLKLQTDLGIKFYSLQKGEAAADLTDQSMQSLHKHLHDFSDTAHVLQHLDLVISVDTSLVHLAGAMGREVWTLLPLVPDWRWLTERDDSPWYPSMRLFRQNSRADWAGVFQQVTDALRTWLENR